MRTPKAIICDWDGTLCGTYAMAMKKTWAAFAARGFEVTEAVRTDVFAHWGRPLPEFLEIVLPGVSAAQVESICRFYHTYDLENPATLIPGARDVIDRYLAEGMHFTILTSRDSETLEHLMRETGVSGLFSHIATKDTVRNCKPHPDALECTIGKLTGLGIHQDDCVLVGDTMEDFNVAKNMGIRFVLVLTGPFSQIPLHPHVDPDQVIDSFAQLPDWLDKHIAA